MKRWGLGIAGALFYAAPIGAGMTGAAYFAALPFAGLFLLWILIMRAEPFRDGPAFVLPTLMVHLTLATICLGLGQMLRVIFGIEATVPLLPWLILGLGALIVGRGIWQPDREAELEAHVERALKRLNDFADDAEEILDHPLDLPLAQATPAEAEELAMAYGALDALPAETASEAEIAAILAPLKRDLRAHVLITAFLTRAERTDAHRDRLAAVMLALDGGLAWQVRNDGAAAEVFDMIVAEADSAALAQFIAAAEALLDDFPTLRDDLPDVARLIDISGQIEAAQPDLAEALVALANRVETLSQEPDDD